LYLRFRTYKSGGKGGQHRQKNDTAVEVTHIPTGLKAHSDSERSQWQNKQLAIKQLKYKVAELKQNEYSGGRAQERREQVGTGLRGDKVQTVQEQNDQVVNHVTGQSMSYKVYAKGNIDMLHN
jgi:peptide chain release factor 1